MPISASRQSQDVLRRHHTHFVIIKLEPLIWQKAVTTGERRDIKLRLHLDMLHAEYTALSNHCGYLLSSWPIPHSDLMSWSGLGVLAQPAGHSSHCCWNQCLQERQIFCQIKPVINSKGKPWRENSPFINAILLLDTHLGHSEMWDNEFLQALENIWRFDI